MNRKGKSWPLFVVAILIVLFSLTAIFGVSYTYGDTKNVYVKGASDIRFGIDIRGVILEYYLKEHGLAAADFARTVEIGNIGAIKTLLKSGYGVSFLYRAAIRPEEAAGALGVIALSDFELRHDIMFLFPKNSNFRADYTTIFRELRACAEETGGA